jgi:hypothetical protein
MDMESTTTAHANRLAAATATISRAAEHDSTVTEQELKAAQEFLAAHAHGSTGHQ